MPAIRSRHAPNPQPLRERHNRRIDESDHRITAHTSTDREKSVAPIGSTSSSPAAMLRAKRRRYVWVADRHTGILEEFETTSNERVNTID